MTKTIITKILQRNVFKNPHKKLHLVIKSKTFNECIGLFQALQQNTWGKMYIESVAPKKKKQQQKIKKQTGWSKSNTQSGKWLNWVMQ